LIRTFSPSLEVHKEIAIMATLDVRPILARGEEPFDTIMETVATLGPGESLEILAPFEPVPLFSVLGAQGFQHVVQPMGKGEYRVVFRKP
jgi:uncharacterized protein (DUF2249 family)